MKIKSITPVGKKQVYDISVAEVEHYILDNGVASHNTGSYYSSDNIFIIGRQQDKDAKTNEIVGWDFVINVEKSRYVREKSKISISVSYDGGISPWSGLLDNALESGHVTKPKSGWYAKVDSDGVVSENLYRESATNTKEFWEPIINDQKFKDFIHNKYAVVTKPLVEADIDEAFPE
jgi:hypothetical protein